MKDHNKTTIRETIILATSYLTISNRPLRARAIPTIPLLKNMDE